MEAITTSPSHPTFQTASDKQHPLHIAAVPRPTTRSIHTKRIRRSNPLPPPATPRPATVRNIVAEVAAFHTITADHILSPNRKHGIVRPRQIACYLAKNLTKLSLSQIGKRIGGRDHSTVLHSIQKVERLMVSDELLANQIDALRQRFILPNPEILGPDDPTPAPITFIAEDEAEEQAEHAGMQA
jgi:hypothetical protein